MQAGKDCTMGGRSCRKVMNSVYGSRPEDILTALGPSIDVHHYEVGEDVIQEVQRHLALITSLLPVRMAQLNLICGLPTALF
jgi:copper oxidase (laccase) domain-containing protein